MNASHCAFYIAAAGAVGGLLNALLSDRGFMLPTRVQEILCPGFLGNMFIGSIAALLSWSLYGSGVAIDLALKSGEQPPISLKLPALAGACAVGIAGARWLSSQIDERLFRESVKEAAKRTFTPQESEGICIGSAKQVLEAVTRA